MLSKPSQVATAWPFKRITMEPPGPFGFGEKVERVMEKAVTPGKTVEPQTVATFSPRSSNMSTTCWLQAGEVMGVAVGVQVMVGVSVIVGELVGVELGVKVGVFVAVLEMVGVTVSVGVLLGVSVGV